EKAAAEKAAAEKAAAEKAAAEKAAAEKAAAEKAAAEKAAVAGTSAVKTAVGQVSAVVAQEQTRIQGVIDNAKNLIGQKKYSEALKTLGDLANVKLTPEQQATVDNLTQAAQKLAARSATEKAAAGAAQSISDALGGKK
ncbi:MAG: hypothetical protein JXQ71_04245, partial [Verrucomicrobia bacterium]|nr:hypothetical protein [Verrucomicrobiota bacterium]